MSDSEYPTQGPGSPAGADQNSQQAQPSSSPSQIAGAAPQPQVQQQPQTQVQPQQQSQPQLAYRPSQAANAVPPQPHQAQPQPAYRPSQAAPASQPTARATATGSASGYRPAAPASAPATSAATAKQTGGWLKSLIAGAVGAILATVITLAVSSFGATPAGQANAGGTTVVGGTGGTTINVSGEDVTLPEAVAAKSLPSVVCIYVYTQQSTYGWIGGGTGGEQMTGLGSGVILSEDGYIITNYHVIEGESSLKVSVNGEQHDAKVVGTDPTSDLAVVKIDGAKGLTPIEIGSSSDLVVGEWVMTVGAPYGMEQSVGSGIVSAVSRSSASLQDSEGGAIYANMIQTDAPINPGNSGGALVDKDGKLVGINTLAATYSGSNAGVGFAIPSDYAVSIANQIIAGETPSHAQLGVSLVTIDSAAAQRYGLAVSSGAYVTAASAGAADAGIQEGDIIVKVNGKSVTSATDVILQVRSSKVGDTIPVEVNRNGETKTMDVKLTSDTGEK